MKIAALLVCLLAPAPVRAQGSLPALVRQGAAALNRRDARAFDALAAPGVDTAWARDATAAPDPAQRPWVAGTLRFRRQTWVVFSLDKAVEMDHDHLYRAARRGGRWRLAGSIDEAEPGRHWRITGHDERVVIDPERRSARFVDTFRVRPLPRGGPLIFDLGHDYEVEALRLGSRVVSWTRAGNLIRVNAPVGPGATLRVAYRRAFHHGPGFLSNITPQDALLDADWLPVISFQPAPSRITIDTPTAWGSIAPGDLTRTRRQGSRIVRTFTNRAPVSFIMAAAGPYTVTRRKSHGCTLATYMLTDDRKKSERGLETLAFAMPFYIAHFGPIPWKHYTLVETGALQDLAQEGYSYSVYSTAAFPGECAHELGHSWWGGRVNNTYFRSYASGGNFPLINAAWVARRGRVLASSDVGIKDRCRYVFPRPTAPAIPGGGQCLVGVPCRRSRE